MFISEKIAKEEILSNSTTLCHSLEGPVTYFVEGIVHKKAISNQQNQTKTPRRGRM